MSRNDDNQLAGSASPYLLQHADNPVHWRPWSNAIFNEARARDCPILLSIGYSACHWCHVMAHESFDDPTAASVMNAHFVNVKVDREERPEIDQIYMAALTAMGIQGGWPLTMFLTPDGKPFYGGTYFPPIARYGQPAFTEVLNAIQTAWTSRRGDIDSSAETIHTHLASALAGNPGANIDADARMADHLADRVASMIDPIHGGLQGAPKFPNAPYMENLWLSALRRGVGAHRTGFIDSLRRMLNGGIYDHIGGGLCRYSTDEHWLVPHFEKMLYDNAAMLRHASWAYVATKEEMFRDRIEQTIAWLTREMMTDDGAFASSLDADSEGEEGKFYVWSLAELQQVLDADDAALFAEAYDITAQGNWEGRNIPNRSAGIPLDDKHHVRLDALREKLREHRSARIPPGRDDKVITEWNGLMIRALAECAMALDHTEWTALAAKAYQAVASRLPERANLAHCYRAESTTVPAVSSDYAAMINAALALYEATGDERYLDDARLWAQTLQNRYGDGADGYYFTADNAEDVPIRTRGDRDDAITGATAQIIEALHRLSLIAGDADLAEKANRAAEAALRRAAQQQYGQAGIANAAALVSDPIQLVITGDTPEDLLRVAWKFPDPRRVTLSGVAGRASIHPDIDGSRSAAWLCRAMTCLPPITDAKELEAALRDSQNLPPEV